MQVVQVFYGTYMAAEVAYYTYMYAKVDKSRYQIVSGHVKAALLSGRFTASLLGQLLYNFDIMDVRQLNYITLSAQAISFIFAILLPGVGTSLYFYYAGNTVIKSNNNAISETADVIVMTEINSNNDDDDNNKLAAKFSARRALNLMYTQFCESYKNIHAVTLPSIWWALAMCGFLQVQSYVQFLWKVIDEEERQLFNGGVEAILTLLGVLSALLAGSINMKLFKKHQMLILAVCALFEGVFILVSATTKAVIVAYLMYIAFGVLYSFMITLI